MPEAGIAAYYRFAQKCFGESLENGVKSEKAARLECCQMLPRGAVPIIQPRNVNKETKLKMKKNIYHK